MRLAQKELPWIAPLCKLRASPMSFASSLCCTNTFFPLPQYTPSMAVQKELSIEGISMCFAIKTMAILPLLESSSLQVWSIAWLS